MKLIFEHVCSVCLGRWPRYMRRVRGRKLHYTNKTGKEFSCWHNDEVQPFHFHHLALFFNQSSTLFFIGPIIELEECMCVKPISCGNCNMFKLLSIRWDGHFAEPIKHDYSSHSSFAIDNYITLSMIFLSIVKKRKIERLTCLAVISFWTRNKCS